MTGIRKSFCFCRERDGFGTGIATSDAVSVYMIPHDKGSFTFNGQDPTVGKMTTHDVWLAPPPGSFFTHTHTREVQRIQTTGSKFWDTQAYGKVGGTWEWTFPLDYDYIEPLLFVFEDVVYYGVFRYLVGQTNTNVYSFRKANSRRVRSFTVRIVIDDQMIGSAGNEETILKGCVVTEAQFSKSNSESPMKVSLKGFYAYDSLSYGSSIPKTVYKDMQTEGANGLLEWAALYKGTFAGSKFMANTESVSITVGNSAAAVYSVCSPFASNYYEGLANVAFSASVWYTDPLQYRAVLMEEGESGHYSVKSKGVRPFDEISLLVTNLEDLPFPGNYSDVPFSSSDPSPMYNPQARKTSAAMYAQNNIIFWATAYALFRLNRVAVKSYVAEKGDGSPLKDSLSGADCHDLILDIVQGGKRNNSATVNVELKKYAPIYVWARFVRHSQTTTSGTDTIIRIWYTVGDTYVLQSDDPYGYGFIMASDEHVNGINQSGKEVYEGTLDAWFSPIGFFTTLSTTGSTTTYHEDGTSETVAGETVTDDKARCLMVNPHAVGFVVSPSPPTSVEWNSLDHFKSDVANYNSAHDTDLDDHNLSSGKVVSPSAQSRAYLMQDSGDEGPGEDNLINIEQGL